MEDLYKILQVAPGVDREAIRAAYERLKTERGGIATADLDHAYEVLSHPERRRVYDYSRIDPRGLRALFNIEDRKEKVVWNIEGRKGEEPPPPPAPLDPWGLDQRHNDEPFDGEIEIFDPLDEPGPSAAAGVSPAWGPAPDTEDDDEPGPAPGQEFAWDLPSDEESSRSRLNGLGHPESPAAAEAPEVDADFDEVQATPAKAPPRATPKTKKKATGESVKKARANGRAKGATRAVPKTRDSPRHARTAAAQLLATPPTDLEAVTLTSYNPDDFAQEKPPSWWNPVNLVSLLSFVFFTAAAIGGVYYLWESSEEESEEPLAVNASDDVLASLAPPPALTGDPLPEGLEQAARAHVDGFSGPLGERYTYLGSAGTVLANGSHFFAVAARDRASLDGSHQRIFFFVDETPVGVDWPIDSRSVAEIEALDDGRIRVVYNAFADGDLACCASLPPVRVFFSYNGALESTLSEPPPEILIRQGP